MVMSNQIIEVDQDVLVLHDQWTEYGQVYSINHKSGKAVIYISNPECPHFFTTNISRLRHKNIEGIQ
jgi:hypothetical protein